MVQDCDRKLSDTGKGQNSTVPPVTVTIPIPSDSDEFLSEFCTKESDNIQRIPIGFYGACYGSKLHSKRPVFFHLVNQARSTTPLNVRTITDPRFVYGSNEDFSRAFECQAAVMSFHAWLGRTFNGSHHVLTLLEPLAYALDIIVWSSFFICLFVYFDLIHDHFHRW